MRAIEKLPTPRRTTGLPDAALLPADTLVIFDHAKHQLTILANAHNTGDPDAAYDDALARIDAITAQLQQPLPPQPEPIPAPEADRTLRSNVTRERFEEMVRAAKEYIAAGDAFQIVLSQRFSRRTSSEPFSIYRAHGRSTPAVHVLPVLRHQFNDRASPEMMVRLEDGTATNPPNAERARAARPKRNAALAANCWPTRRSAGHVMLVDLGATIRRVCA